MTSSWISSDFTPDTVAIRDDGEAAKPEKKDSKGTVTEAAVPERGAWPAGHFVHIRTVRSGGDLKRMRLHLNAARQQATDAGLDPEQTNNFVGHEAILANAAAYVVRLEGEGFTDPETYDRDEDGKPVPGSGEPLLIEGSFDERLAAVERIPEAVLEYVFSEVTRRQVADPLGLQPNGTGGRSKSQTSSSRHPSRPTPVK